MNAAVKSADKVLASRSSDAEEDIRVRICQILNNLGYDEYHLERRVGSGSADIYLPRLRTIIETKSTGKANRPNDRPSAEERTPFEQLNGYLQSKSMR